MPWFTWSRFVLQFPTPPAPFQAFRDHSKWTNYNWYHYPPHVRQVFSYYYHYFTLFWAFHTSVTWWFSTGVWVMAIVLKSPRFFLIFGLILIISFIWILSTHPLIYKSSSPFINTLVTVPSAPITTGITVTFLFHSSSSFSYYYYYYFLCIFHISWSFPLESEWQQVFSSLKSPGLFLVFWLISAMLSLDGFHSSSYFQVL